MLGLVHTLLFDLSSDTQHSSRLQDEEEKASNGAGPGANRQDTETLDSKLLATSGSTGEKAVVPLGGEETSSDNTPGTTEEVDWSSSQRIINLQREEKLAGASVDNTSNKSKNKGRPWLSDVASGSDTDESSQDSVKNWWQVGLLSSNNLARQSRDATGGSGKGSRDGALGGKGHVGPGTSRAAVESIPSKPKNEGTNALKRGGVAWDVNRLSVGTKLSDTRSEEEGSHEGSTTTSHVNNTTSGKVKEAWSNVTVSQPSLTAPRPVSHDRVDKGGKEDGVGSVGTERAALSDGSGHDGSGSRGEGPLEEPEGPVGRAVRLVEGGEEVLSSNELVWGVAFDSECEAVPAEPPQDGAEASVQGVLDENVLGVLGTNASRFEKRETGLHEEDEASSEEEPKAISRGTVVLKKGPHGCRTLRVLSSLFRSRFSVLVQLSFTQSSSSD